MNDKQTKRGRGRPKGATSFVNLNMNQLKDYVGEYQAIPVSRVWLEKMGIDIVEQKSSVQAQPRPATTPPVEMKLSD